jgi:hemolysin activation/secretion protein
VLATVIALNTTLTTKVIMCRFRRIVSCAVLSIACTICGAPARAQPSDEPQFEVVGYEIEGELPIARDRAQAILVPFTGNAVTLSQLKDAAKALETAISEAGFPFYRVILPAQSAETVVKLRVLTFRLGGVTVRNNRYFSTENVLRGLPALRPGQPTNVSELARNRAAVNDHPSKGVEVNFVQGEKADAVDAEVTVQDERPVRLFVAANNVGNKQTGDYRVTVGLQHANLWDRDHSVTATYSTSPDHIQDVKQYGLYYRMPFYSVGGALTLFYAHSDANSGIIAGAFQVSGRGTFTGAHYRQHLVPIGAYAHGLEVGVDDRLFENDVLFGGAQLGVDVRTRPLLFGYDGRLERVAWTLAGGIQYVHNLPGGSESSSASYEGNRAGATRSWDAIRASLDGQWRMRPITFVGRVRAQYSDDNLIPGEQFGLGGAFSVRGLREREVTGDSGIFASVEALLPLPWEGLSVAAFVDAGHVTVNNVTPGFPESQQAIGIGIGVRWVLARRFSASLDAAQVLNGTTVTNRSTRRIHAATIYWF